MLKYLFFILLLPFVCTSLYAQDTIPPLKNETTTIDSLTYGQQYNFDPLLEAKKEMLDFIPPRLIIEDDVIDGDNIEEEEDKVYNQTETWAEFSGGTQAMLKFIKDNLRYPPNAYKQGIEGRVVVKMIVDKRGYLSDIKILRSLHADCDAEAIRIVESMPRWTPATLRGKDVALNCFVAIEFKIKE